MSQGESAVEEIEDTGSVLLKVITMILNKNAC